MRAKRYAFAMLILLVAATAAYLPQNVPGQPVGATVQARATIRIISGAVLRLGVGATNGEAPPALPTFVHADGAAKAAKLIEFE
jgi:hypothetical protein